MPARHHRRAGGDALIFSSTVDPSYRAGLSDAVAGNVPPAGGLYQPLLPPAFDDVEDLLALDWRRRSSVILSRLLAPDFSAAEVDALVAEAFDFPLPRVTVTPNAALLELFHGPTLSFKDFGVRFQAALMARLRERDADASPRLVLTATSGDTGAAVADAFSRRPGFRVAVLYPAGRISPLQERQIATVGGSVRAFAVEGSFDDCQRLVKDCFADADLHRELGLVSANSIHVARLLAQVPYYFEAAAHVASGAALVVAVPSGNFGNLCAGLIARRLGAPIRALVAATNLNRTVPDFLDGGPYAPRPSVATLSNAMDVGAPSNWQRVTALYSGDTGALRRELRWGSTDENGTRAAIAELDALGYRADPHTAVAWGVLRRLQRAGESGVVLATAHPAKFEATLDPDAPLPEPLARAANRPLLTEPLVAESHELRARLRRWAPQPSPMR